MTLAFDIKKARESKKLSQTQVGEMLSKVRGTTAQVLVCGWEQGKRPIDVPDEKMAAFAALLDVSEDEARSELRKYARSYKQKLRARRVRAAKKVEPKAAAPAPVRAEMSVLEAIIETWPKPAGTGKRALFTWYNEITTIHETLKKARS